MDTFKETPNDRITYKGQEYELTGKEITLLSLYDFMVHNNYTDLFRKVYLELGDSLCVEEEFCLGELKDTLLHFSGMVHVCLKGGFLEEVITKKVLTLGGIHLTKEGQISFHIAEQSHRGDEFYKGKNSFTASNGLVLDSCIHPDIWKDTTFHVRGSSYFDDLQVLTVAPNFFTRIAEAVTEYNKEGGN